MRYELTRTTGFSGCASEQDALDNVRPPKQWQYRCRASHEREEGKRVYRVYIQLYCLHELEEFREDCGCPLIVTKRGIEIYDGWRE